MREPVIGIRAQTVMYMEGKDFYLLRLSVGMQQMQQGCRVEAAAIGQCDFRAGSSRARKRNARPDLP
ncbi:hypothetical protein D3C81_2006510 [compost metagenome]